MILVYLIVSPIVLFFITRWVLLARPKGLKFAPVEKTFFDPESGNIPFTTIFEKPTIYLSIVVPAYKEELRLPVMLEETLSYLRAREASDKNFTWEIIVVDDGSTDKTTQVALEYVKKEGAGKMRVLTLLKNKGKGGAVRRGMYYVRGQYILMVDADGATKFSDLDKVESQLKNVEKDGLGISVGSRAHLVDTDTVAKRKWYRNILMYGFHFLVDFLCVKGIKDTQCGFKLFTRRAASIIFPNLHIERWAFDVELLYMAQSLGIPLAEVPVNWQEIEGSKVDPLTSSIQMGRDLLRIRGNYLIGWWRIEHI